MRCASALGRYAATLKPMKLSCALRSATWVLGLGTLAVSSTALGFCRTTTVPTAQSYDPREGGCWTQGIPQFWAGRCAGYSIHSELPTTFGYDEVAEVVARSFARWTTATCPSDGTGRSRVSIDVRDLGAVACGKAGRSDDGKNKGSHNKNGLNQNVITFRDGNWEYGDLEKDSSLALTFTYYNKDTGEILGADMAINLRSKDYNKIVIGIPKAGEFDLESIVTHEAGHFLGLAHSVDVNATMFYSYNEDAVPTAGRILGPDDIGGICSIYPPDGARPAGDGSATQPARPCDPTPLNGLISECPDTSSSACSRAFQIAPQSTPWSGWLVSTGAATSVIALRRWRRRRQSQR